MTCASSASALVCLANRFKRSSKRLRVVVALALAAIAGAAAASASFTSVCARLLDLSRGTGSVKAGQITLVKGSAKRLTFAAPLTDTQLNIARSDHTATLLADGRVLIVGGENQTGFVTEAEIFDPGTRGFSVSGSLHTPRAAHTATCLSDGRVLIAGGRGDPGALNSTEIFDPMTGAFMSGPNLNSPRTGQTATALVDGRIVLAGGDAFGSIEIYDPSANTFAFSGAHMTLARAQHGAALLSDGRILFAGGAAPDGSPALSGEILDLADLSFTLVRNQTTDEHIRPTLRVLPDGKVQIIGGTAHEDVEIYDPALNAFGAHAHVFPIGDSHPELLQQIMDAPTRAAMFGLGASSELLNRTGQTITELCGSTQALVAGGVDSTGAFLKSASTLNSSAATVSTDKLDYPPGTPVLVSGTGWQPNEFVTIMFHEDPHIDTENPHTFTVQTDASGKFVNQQYAPEDHDNGSTYILAVIGGTSGRTAQTAFTDATFAAAASGLWNNPTTWGFPAGAPVPGTNIPGSTDAVIIAGNFTVTVNISNAACQSVQLGAGGTTNGTLLFNSGSQLTVSGNVVIGASGAGAGAGTITMTTGGTLQVGGAFSIGTGGGTFTAGTGTVEYNSNGAQSIFLFTYNNLTLSGIASATKTLASPTTVNGVLTVNSTFGNGGNSLSGTGNIVVNSGATFNWNNASAPAISGTKTFNSNSSFNYIRNGAQDVAAYTYANLTLSGTSGPKTLLGATSINGNLSINQILAAGTNNIQIGGNWTALASFTTSGSQKVTFTGTGIQTLTGVTTFNNLEVDKSAGGMTLSAPQTVNGTLMLTNGIITTGSFTLTVGVAGSATSGSSTSYMDGKLARVYNSTGSRTFPIGRGGNFRPLSLNYTALTGTSTVTAEQTEAAFPGAAPSSEAIFNTRYWTVSQTGGSAFTYNITLDGTGYAPTNTAAVRILKYSGTTTTSTATVFGSPKYTASGFTAFSDFALAEAPAGSLQFSSASYSDGETNADHIFNIPVTRTGGSGGAVAIDYSVTDGTATTAAADYSISPASGTLNWADGDSASRNIAITIKGDAEFENDETVNITISTPGGGAALGSPNTAVLTITNDDNPPSFSIDDVTHFEGDAGTTTYTFTVTRTGTTALASSVDFATQDATATTANDDYVLSTGTLSFAPGDTMKQILVTVNADTTVEADEQFKVHLSNPTDATIGVADGTGTITNDDTDVSAAAFPAAVAEDGGTNLTYTFTRAGVTTGLLTVNFTVGGTATFGTDYTQTGADSFNASSGTVTFTGSNTSVTVTVDPATDSTYENDETVDLTVTSGTGYSVGSSALATALITNDDAAPSFSIDDVTQTEGNSGTTTYTFTVTRTGNTALISSVNFTTQDDSATIGNNDYVLNNGTLNFDPDDTMKPITVTINGDTTVEPDEQFVVTLNVPTNATVLDGSGTGTILNDDTDVSVAVAPAAVNEDDATNLVYTFTRTGLASGSLTVNFSVSGTATFNADYTPTGGASFSASSGTVTFTGSNTTATVTIHPTADTIDEPNETVILTVVAGTGYNVGAPSAVTGTITDDDVAPIISIGDVYLSEGNSGQTAFNFLVTLSNASSTNVTVDYTTQNNTATQPGDYTFNSGTLTFLAGETSKQIIVRVNGDTTYEANEDFFVNLSGETNATVTDNQGLGTITNDDSQPKISINSVTQAEGNSGSSNFTFTVSLSNDSYETVTVDYATDNDTATALSDYTTVPTTTLIFAAGATSKQVQVSVNGDSTHETNESFFVDLTNPGNATIANYPGVGTIINDDAPPSFTVSDVSMAEGNSGTTNFVFTVIRTGATEVNATVNFATANGATNPATSGLGCFAGGDYQSQTGTLTFTPTDTTKTIAVAVCGDISSESNETFFVNLSGPAGATIGDDQGLGTINNDDSYIFQGFFAPIDNAPIVNTVKAGSSVPVKWRLTLGSVAVSDPSTFAGLFSYEVTCGTTTGLESPVETLAPGESGLQYLGDGNWQINWKTVGGYSKGSCRVLDLQLGDGTHHYANFKFK